MSRKIRIPVTLDAINVEQILCISIIVTCIVVTLVL